MWICLIGTWLTFYLSEYLDNILGYGSVYTQRELILMVVTISFGFTTIILFFAGRKNKTSNKRNIYYYIKITAILATFIWPLYLMCGRFFLGPF